MLTLVNRNGPPETQTCPVILCEACRKPIHGSGNAVWFEYWDDDYTDLERSRVYFVHKGPCDRKLEAAHARSCPGRSAPAHPNQCFRHYRWYELSDFLDHLGHNFHVELSTGPGVSFRYAKPHRESFDGD